MSDEQSKKPETSEITGNQKAITAEEQRKIAFANYATCVYLGAIANGEIPAPMFFKRPNHLQEVHRAKKS